MANLQYSRDIKAHALEQAFEPSDGTSDFDTLAENYVNQHYQGLWLGGRKLDPRIDNNWWWLRKPSPGTLVLNPLMREGTVAVTNASDQVTFSMPPAVEVTGRLFRVEEQPDVFRITQHTAGNATATLDAPWTNETSPGLAYRLMQVDYTLAPDVLRVVSPMRVDRVNTNYDPYKIYGTNVDTMERDWPTSIIHMGVPEQFAMVHQSATAFTIRMNRYGLENPTQFIRVEYDYLVRPALLTFAHQEEPLVPHEWRVILADAAAADLLSIKNDDRAGYYLQSAQAALQDMDRHNRFDRITMSWETGQIMPRQYRRMNRVLRTESGLIIG